jgi:cytochrome b6
LGTRLTDIVRGGPEVSEFTVQRFFALHAVILPALFIPLLALHLWLVQKHGNAVPPSVEKLPAAQRRSVPFFPNFLLKDMAVWLIALNVLTLLAALFPWDLGSAADALKSAPAGIHPEWYFMSAFQILKLFGGWFPGAAGEAMGMIIFNVGLLLWFLIPLFDGNTKSGARGRTATYFGLIVLGLLMLTTVWGYVAL